MHPLVDSFYKGRTVLKRQAEKFFDSPKKPKKACAIGAIYYGLYGTATENFLGVPSRIVADYPQIRNWVKVAPCEHDEGGGTIIGILIHLNDFHTGHDWNDKRIAEWLERVLVETSEQNMPPVQ